MNYDIKRTNGSVEWIVKTVRPTGTQSKKAMGESVVDMSFTISEYIDFKINDFVEVYGETYKINVTPSVKKLAKRKFEYQIQFEHLFYDLAKVQLQFLNSKNQLLEPVFNLMGNAATIVSLIVENANRHSPGWTVGVVDDTAYENFSFNAENCLQVLSRLASQFETEFWIENKTIHLQKREQLSGLQFEYGQGKGLYSIFRSNKSNINILTRLYVRGGSRNLAVDYRNYSSSLLLPNGATYIQDDAKVNPQTGYGLIEGTIVFENIFPQREGTISAVVAGDGNWDKFTDSSLDFDVNAYKLAPPAKIAFNTGQLAGYEFVVNYYNHATKQFTITQNNDEALKVPSNLIRPAVGDKYVILDIKMPTSYVTAAETKLLSAAWSYYNKNSNPSLNFAYAVDCDPIWFKQQNVTVVLGTTVVIYDADLGINGEIRIAGYKRDLQIASKFELEISDSIGVNEIVRQYAQQQRTLQLIESSGLLDINQIRKNLFLNRLSESDGYLMLSGVKTKAGIADYAPESGHALNANYADEAGHALQADYALDADKWDGKQFDDYLNQGVKKTDAVTFLSVTANNVIGETVNSKNYVSGFTGVGYKINPDGSAEFDSLTVRKELNINVLNVREITGSGGSVAITNVAKIKDVTSNTTDWRCTINTDDNTIAVQFRVNDVVRCQVWDGKRLKYYSARVKAISTGYFDLDKTGKTGTGVPAPGDSVFQFGNTTDATRQGLIYITNSDTGAPYLDILDGITSDNLAGKTKVRLGKLTGITDPDLGVLDGYGLYAQSAYIKGKIVVTGGNAETLTGSQTKANAAQAAAIAAAATDAQTKANTAKTAAETAAKAYADAQDALRKTEAAAYADGIVTAEEQARITADTQKLAEAKADAATKANAAQAAAIAAAAADAQTKANTAKAAAETAAKAYADAQDSLRKTEAAAYADGIVTAEEQARIEADTLKLAEAKADATAKANAAQAAATAAAAADATAKANEAKMYTQGKAYATGKMLYRDAEFLTGMNGISTYNNLGGNTVVLQRLAASTLPGVPTNSGFYLNIKNTGAAAPGVGGFTFSTGTRANAKFVTRLIANIPVGYVINFAGNQYGTGATFYWATPVVGTGKWEEYICVATCGSTGTFSGINYFYLTGAIGVEWNVASASVYDVTMSEVDYLKDAQAKADAALVIAQDYALAKANIAQGAAIQAAATDATTKANNAKTAAEAAAATYAQTVANSASSAAQIAAAADATIKANAAKDAAIAAAEAARVAFANTLKAMAYQDVVEVAKLGSSVIIGGMLKNTLIDTVWLKANIINATEIVVNGGGATVAQAQSLAASAQAAAVAAASTDATNKTNTAKTEALAYADKVSQTNKVDNPSVSGNAAGWTPTGAGALTISTEDFFGVPTPVLKSVSDGNHQVYSKYFDVDPAKTYECTIWVKSTDNVNTKYFGINPVNAVPNQVSVQFISDLNGAEQSTTNFYFNYKTASNPTWTRWTGYILPTGFTGTDAIGIGSNVLGHAKIPSSTKQVALRWLNWNNAGTSRTVYIANPSVVEVSPQTFVSNKKAIEAVQIGGRNLQRNSNFISSSVFWSLYGNATLSLLTGTGKLRVTFAVAGSGWGVSLNFASNLLEVDQQYTVSAKITTTKALSVWVNVGGVLTTNVINGIGYISGTGTALSANKNLIIYASGMVSGDYFEIEFVKVEQGNKATAWTLAQEDVQANIDSALVAAQDYALAKANIAQGAAIQAAATDATTKANNAKTSAEAAAATYAQTIANSASSAAQIAAAADATTKANAARDAAIATAEAARVAFANTLKSMAFQDVVEVAKLGTSVMVGGMLKNTLIDTVWLKANIINATEIVVNGGGATVAQAQGFANTAQDNAIKAAKIETVAVGVRRFNNVVGHNTGGATTGMLVIRTPITFSYMTDMRIVGYNYAANTNIDLNLSFYAYTSNQFFNYAYTSLGKFAITKVRLYRDASGQTVIVIQDVGQVWSYPKIQVEQVTLSHTIAPDSFVNGWSAVIVNALPSDLVAGVTLNGNDLQTEAAATSAAASTAQNTATLANTNALNAQTSANTANNAIADIANDDLLTVSEKQDTLKEWQQIQGEYTIITNQAIAYALNRTAFTNAFTALQSYLTPLLASLSQNSSIVGTTFRSTFKTYYDAKVDLLKAVSDRAKVLADTAQTSANTAATNLTNLQNALKGMAYQDVVELAKLGSTIIVGGVLKNTLIDTVWLKANVINALYIQSLDIVSKKIRTAETGQRVEMMSDNTIKFYTADDVVPAVTIDDDIIDEVTNVTPVVKGPGIIVGDGNDGAKGYVKIGRKRTMISHDLHVGRELVTNTFQHTGQKSSGFKLLSNSEIYTIVDSDYTIIAADNCEIILPTSQNFATREIRISTCYAATTTRFYGGGKSIHGLAGLNGSTIFLPVDGVYTFLVVNNVLIAI